MSLEPSRPGGIVGCPPVVAMNSAVQFQHEAQVRTIEVDDEPTYRVLPSELQIKDPSIAQQLPGASLRARRMTSKLSRAFERKIRGRPAPQSHGEC